MGSFGERLRREREMRGITLEEIAEATKIGTRSLRALELEQFEKLPGGIFNKGFVRAYARFLGIDEEQAVADYLSVAKQEEEPLPAIFPVPPAKVSEAESGTEAPERAGLPWRFAAVLVAVAVFAAGARYGYQRWRGAQALNESVAPSTDVPAQAPSLVPQMGMAATTPEAISAPAPSPATIPPPANAQAARPELKPTKVAAQKAGTAPPAVAPIALRIRAHADAWLQVTADDKIVMSEILPAAGERVIRADKRVVLDIGNAGGVDVTYNGKSLAPFGPEGKRKLVTFTPEGVQE